ncbi:hypothetical protein C0991_004790 [Blastosporella zonata]|nr:hypothetical protein C0991_004790 [Blastosporella zonata]
MSLGRELGGESKVEAMIKKQGVSLILKSIDIVFDREVTFPDTVLVGYRPQQPSLEDKDPAAFKVTASAYSFAQKAIVATSNEALAWIPTVLNLRIVIG